MRFVTHLERSRYGCISFFGRSSGIDASFYKNKTSAGERARKLQGLVALDSKNKTIGMFGGRIGAVSRLL
jgi:hypothetical protein